MPGTNIPYDISKADRALHPIPTERAEEEQGERQRRERTENGEHEGIIPLWSYAFATSCPVLTYGYAATRLVGGVAGLRRYRGEWKGSQMHGIGSVLYEDGSFYFGQLEHNKYQLRYAPTRPLQDVRY